VGSLAGPVVVLEPSRQPAGSATGTG